MATAGTGSDSIGLVSAATTVHSPALILPGANISSTPAIASQVDWPSRIRGSISVTSGLPTRPVT